MAGLIFSLLYLVVILLGPGLAAIAIYYSLPIGWQLLLLGFCIFYSVSPFLIGWIGLILADRFGCKAESGTLYKCPQNPQLGDLVTLMVFIGAWGAIITLPSGILGVIGLLISLGLKFYRLNNFGF
ncbi:hypothetical protein NIES2111_18120 [Nostoc sp. NIES-2111]|nr:hypothetical protein NIES2111_18120 [Nostoc sp. NIES-2111]